MHKSPLVCHFILYYEFFVTCHTLSAIIFILCLSVTQSVSCFIALCFKTNLQQLLFTSPSRTLFKIIVCVQLAVYTMNHNLTQYRLVHHNTLILVYHFTTISHIQARNILHSLRQLRLERRNRYLLTVNTGVPLTAFYIYTNCCQLHNVGSLGTDIICFEHAD